MNRNRREDDEERGCLGGPGRAAWGCAQTFVALYGFAASMYLLARITIGETSSIVAYFNNALPWMAVLALVLAIVALLSRWRGLLISLQLPVIFAALLIYNPVLLPTDPPAAGTGPQIRVASYNILSGQSDADEIAQVIADIDADVIALHELGPEHTGVIEQQLATLYPYSALHPTEPEHRGVGLFSRYPIEEESAFTIGENSFVYLRAVLDVNGTPVTVFAAHPVPAKNRTNPLTYDDTDNTAELQTLRSMYLAETTGPLLMLCDCNITDQSDAYRALRDMLHDSFWEVGQGLGFTFQSRLPFPFLRLDYVWHNDAFKTLDFTVWDDAGTSDHRPVIAQLELVGEEAAP
jgi:endonuclease/exonuclease/phosphatase (EEP) superfamily protein YafD